MYSTAEAAELLGVTPAAVWRWIKAGYLPASNVGKPGGRVKLRISEDDLRRYIEDRTLRVTA
jgi:excisionase family DNA binding protein